MCLSHPPIPEFGKSSDNTSSNFESNWFHVDFSTDDKSTYNISGEKQRLHWPDWIYDSDNTTDTIMFTVANNLEDFSKIYSAFANNKRAVYTCPKGFVFETTYERSISVLCSNGKWGTEDFDASQKCIGKIKCQFLDSNEKLLKLFCDLALSCAEDDLPEKTDDLNLESDDHLKRKSEDSENWNKYTKTVKYSCPGGHVVKWPNINEVNADVTDFEVICHEDAKWHPLKEGTPQLNMLPSCIRKNKNTIIFKKNF